jgi:hypothetical protein
MYPVKDPRTGLYGYWFQDDWAIAPQFDYAHNFHRGYADVRLQGRVHALINVQGERFTLPSLCGHERLFGEYDSIHFTDVFEGNADYAVFCADNDGRRAWGMLDTRLRYERLPESSLSNVEVIDPVGDYLIIHSKEQGTKFLSGLFSLTERRTVVPVKYACFYPSRDSLWVIARVSRSSTERAMAFFDVEQRRRVSDWYWGAMPFWCGFGAMNVDGQSSWYFVDKNLNPAFDREFVGVERFSHGLAGVYDGDDAGYIDTSGRMRLLLRYDELQPFNQFGWAFANRDQKNWKIDIIDRKGQPHVTELETAVFWDGDYPYFEVERGNERILVDMKLNVVHREPSKRYW